MLQQIDWCKMPVSFKNRPFDNARQAFNHPQDFSMIQRNRSLIVTRNSKLHWTCLIVTVLYFASTMASAQNSVIEECVQIDRVVPPLGLEIDREQRSDWLSQIEILEKQAEAVPVEYRADIEVLTKACRFAIEFRELYQAKDSNKVERLIQLLNLDSTNGRLVRSNGPMNRRGQVRGFFSKVDGSAQPLGLVLPENLPADAKNIPLYVWLHGRGDKATDLHFICERLDKNGEVVPSGAMVLHLWSPVCGYKSAGETDVLEAIDLCARITPSTKTESCSSAFRWVVLVCGTSQHTTRIDLWQPVRSRVCGNSPIPKPQTDNFPPKYEQMLWSVYDVPGYTRNLFNLPVVAYSGELDKQIQAARVMEEAFESEGKTLRHLIGPGMGHKYHPDVLNDLLGQLAEAQKNARQKKDD